MNDTCEILYATPSFTEGIGRILDFGNTLTEYNRSSYAGQADFLALRADWRAVAADLRSAMAEADSELQEQPSRPQLTPKKQRRRRGVPRVISTDMAQKARQTPERQSGNDVPPASLVSASYQFSGPIPSPQDLANYENVMPGLADQIITWFERQSEHRMELERYVTRTNALRANLGLAAGLVVSLAGLDAAAALGLHGHDQAAGIISVAGLGVLASVFVYGSNNQKQERLERAKLMLGQKSDSRDSAPVASNDPS